MRAMGTVLATLTALAGCYGFLAWPRGRRRALGGLEGHDYAHRGLWNGDRPENSLPAFRAAAEAGLGIELDVRLTADGQPVVFHDGTLSRMCGDERAVAECTLAELKTMRLAGTDCAIPTLGEVLTEVAGRAPILVEIKPDRRVAEVCAKTCQAMQASGAVWCMESFHPLAVRWFRRNAPGVLRGQLAYGRGGRKITPANLLVGTLAQNVLGRPDFIAYEAATDRNPAMGLMRLIRPHLVCWTIRSQAEMDRQRARYDLQIFEGFTPKR